MELRMQLEQMAEDANAKILKAKVRISTHSSLSSKNEQAQIKDLRGQLQRKVNYRTEPSS